MGAILLLSTEDIYQYSMYEVLKQLWCPIHWVETQLWLGSRPYQLLLDYPKEKLAWTETSLFSRSVSDEDKAFLQRFRQF
jgi:hypothetical protein